ncbi:uncharacterized protein LOC119440400 [Dermacentor silvarum]|uniref:uncharacterized protein LOC119440400 n=1 Tax=Dermacentor silvarum TaxID=543639 RepID=UPI0021018006|nr:uncharacterized protein LOC119440400 [Dermacentor silvarum]
MQRLPRLAVVIAVLSLPLISGEVKNQLQHEFPDVGKVFEGFRAGLALFDVDNDGDLDCLTTTEVNYDASVPSAVYIWFLQGVNGHEGRNITYYVRPGDGPGQLLLKDQNGEYLDAVMKKRIMFLVSVILKNENNKSGVV